MTSTLCQRWSNYHSPSLESAPSTPFPPYTCCWQCWSGREPANIASALAQVPGWVPHSATSVLFHKGWNVLCHNLSYSCLESLRLGRGFGSGLVRRNSHPVVDCFLCSLQGISCTKHYFEYCSAVCVCCKSRQRQVKSSCFFPRMASNVTACLSPTRGNCCWLLKILSNSWITFLSKSAVCSYPDLHSCIRSAQPHC